MAFLKTVRASGKSDILINLDHVKDLRPVSRKDRRTKVTFVQYDDDVEAKPLTVEADFDHLAADWSAFDDNADVLPLP